MGYISPLPWAILDSDGKIPPSILPAAVNETSPCRYCGGKTKDKNGRCLGCGARR